MTQLQLPRYFLLYLGALVALGPVAMDAYLPALPTMAQALGVSVATLSTSVSTFLVGFAAGQLLGGPLSDQIGRKRVCVIGTLLFILASAAIACSESAGTINLLRALQAFGGGFASITAMAQVRDAYPADEIGPRFATVMMVMMVAPVIAPLFGTALLSFGWQAIFIFQVSYACVLLAIMVPLIPETMRHPPRAISMSRIAHQYGEILLHRQDGKFIAARFALCMGSAAGILLIYVTHASYLYMTYFGIGETHFSVLFGGAAVGLIGANSLSTQLLKRYRALNVFAAVIVFQALLVIAFTGLAYLDALNLSLAASLIILMVSCVGVINPAGATHFMGMFPPHQGGSAAAIQTVSMFVMGSGMGLVASVFVSHSITPIALCMLASSILSLLLLPSIRRYDQPSGRVN
ncbi:multidrug effflux MFS transporter [Gilvimarinus xylanilyticus]|uniref:Bcr/CflA family efflux transporter n=1 Tax=Gilvimarinus xylanilyticus TaxID=2944139 RepID=A0A9X2KS27_9GAMM|nr:multidrug effflux MFS transporter [Gilvimarinus xylanilyticus]MCP8897779.1 multidrug effflux MFS transporter [Gilvimarinus xylanilyticus]